VELHFKIGTAGDVHDIVVVKGPQVLAQAAVDAVRERQYKPARVDGVPTETDASAVFEFKLN
jgi:TonB family protein